MKDELISFETAKLAKERGFSLGYLRDKRSDLPVQPCYDETGKEVQPKLYSASNKHYPRSTQSLLQRWLRDIHGSHLIIIPVVTMGYTFKLTKVWPKDFDPSKPVEIEVPPYKGINPWDYDDYEKTLEAGLIEALKLIKI